MNRIDFDEHFKIQMKAMKFFRVHPNTEYNHYKTLLIATALSLNTTYFVLLINSIINHDLKNKDYFNAIRNFVPVSYYVTLSLNYLLLFVNKKIIAKLIDYIKTDYSNMSNIDKQGRTIMYNYARKGSWIMLRILYLSLACILIFIMKSIIVSLIYKYRDEYRYVNFHEMHYPNFIDDRKQSDILVFIATYMGTLGYTTVNAAIFACVIPLGPITMLHACGQLELIKNKFEDLFKNDNIDERLNEIIKDLQNVYSFIGNINKSFSTTYEILLKQNTLLMSLTSYAVIESVVQGNFAVEYISLFLSDLFTSSVLCYYGDLLMEKGEEVRLAAYQSGWEHVYNPSARKKLLIILTRGVQPTAIRSIFCIINLNTLANVYRTSYTIFNIMRAAGD
uniref:Odorant receptor n=1 Tax=Dendrolimus punctatus TaxID=238572 RepID=A0A2K8GL55_9NEOP|nr:Odorant Receptor 54-2 [Dendrolimus punctatus]